MNTTEDSSGKSPGFWNRQWQPHSTTPQRVFDLLIGIIAPTLCVFFDPVVFQPDGTMGNGFLSDWRLFGYAAIAASTVTLAYYLGTRRASPLLAGMLWGGFLFALLLGILMLPLTLIGLLFVIGVLGFTPFLTSFVFYRNALRCWRDSFTTRSHQKGLVLVILGIGLILGTPATLQGSVVWLTNDALQLLQSRSEEGFSRAVQTLKCTRFVVGSDRIAFAYQRATDENYRDRLARAFKTVTGRNVQDRLAQLND